MIRFYIVPIERSGSQRGPQYFKWPRDPDPANSIDVPWSMKDYGLVDVGVVAADVTTAQHNQIVAHTDVLAIPTNLDNTLNAAAVTTARNFLEALNVPAGWVGQGDTYRAVLRSVTAIFLYMQRVTAITGTTVDWVNVPLSTQVRNIPTVWRDAMTQAATELGYDYSGVTGTTTLRQVLKSMADAWGDAPIYFGLTTL